MGAFVVTATHAQHHDTTLDVTIDGETLHTTAEHRFYVPALDRSGGAATR